MEDNLSCAVCRDLYEDPFLTDCDHSFYQSSISRCREKAVTTSCPVCRTETFSSDLRPIRALSNNMETFVKCAKSDESQQECSPHKEKVQLFGKTDNQSIAVVCQTSRNQPSHKMLPLKETAKEFKEELRTFKKPVQDKKEQWNILKCDYEKTLTHIQDQSVKTEKQIKAEFEKLHQFLREEERIVLEDLNLEKEKKSQEMKERIEKITEEISSLSVTVRDIEQELKEQNSPKFLKKLPAVPKRVKQTPRATEGLINVGKYIGSLQYRVWKKMLTAINTAPVTFDPNTAHPNLLLSEDLRNVRYTGKRKQLPDNPERFDYCACVLGSEGFTSGKHSWEVEVGIKADWDVGVAMESINRKGKISNLNPVQRRATLNPPQEKPWLVSFPGQRQL
ncbi:zinc-binding protein A33-like isoform X3 [Carcharodon carcharias]|uniref:zinc-binding protein A33-like isoform X3 n=1 Tax=Carcharodon carcharias TaxID=13397 RepID=UPI001B7F1F25|nr:zinc-binding protein A33-like isoform X3 [Carcharodon carcharias]